MHVTKTYSIHSKCAKYQFLNTKNNIDSCDGCNNFIHIISDKIDSENILLKHCVFAS